MYEFVRLGSKILLSNFKTLKEPYKLTFSVTNKCNSRCKTCKIWKKKATNELNLNEIKKIFDKINPHWVNITGGEPFLRDDIYDIAKIIEKKNIYIFNLTTNGILKEKIINDIKKILKLSFTNVILVVSLDGPKEIHDKIRGVKGNWDKAVDLFKLLKKIENNTRNFKTYFGYTISSYNVNLINETINELSKEINITMNDFHFNIFHSSNMYYGQFNCGNIEGLEDEIIDNISNILKEKNGYDFITILERKYLKLIKKYFKTGRSPKDCKALTSSCFISPDGYVYPCIGFDQELGNLRNSGYDLKNIWNSEKSYKIRKIIKQNKCKGCWTPCEAYQSILGNLVR